jgi:hypothetical protein
MSNSETSKLLRAAAKMLLFAALLLSASQALGQRMAGTWSERGPELGGRLSAIVASHTDPNLLITASPGLRCVWFCGNVGTASGRHPIVQR